ncbi:MAG: ferrochelatase [Myxococcales bacterium]|nr:ferrochelatase [Myxococcales bacterium]
MPELRTGALLVNLGTPDSPRVRDVRRYLREFLSDPYVIDLPAVPRWLLLNLVILPLRPRSSARAYGKVWLPEGSPLRVHGQALQEAVAAELGEGYVVELAMRYGRPSIPSALERLAAADVARIVALPLFPQYSTAATGSVVAKVFDTVERISSIPPVETLGPFYDDPGFIAAFAAVARLRLDAFRPDFVLMSFHGLPERHLRKADVHGPHCLASERCCDAVAEVNRNCYRAQCFATARTLASALDLATEAYGVAFQSRLGRTPWIRPYTDEVLPELARKGVRRLAIVCPAFVADCLETLEEIGIRGREQWHALGGEDLTLVPSLNADPAWVRATADLIRSAA